MNSSTGRGYRRVEQEDGFEDVERSSQTSQEGSVQIGPSHKVTVEDFWTAWVSWVPWVLVACLMATNWYAWASNTSTDVPGKIFCKLGKPFILSSRAKLPSQHQLLQQ